MVNLIVNSPKTFFIKFVNPPTYFELFDINEGKPYYFRFLDGKTPRIKFNITHPGEYIADVPFEIVKTTDIRTPYGLPELPPPDRNRIQDTEVIFEPGLNDIAFTFSKEGKIVVSDYFLSLPKQIQGYLLYHERAHQLYMNEKDCDLYALVCCLRKGYNRSMCFYALNEILSDNPENNDRIRVIFSEIQKTNKSSV